MCGKLKYIILTLFFNAHMPEKNLITQDKS